MPTDPLHSHRRCHDCGASELAVAAGYAELHRVTSDCKPWPPGGMLAQCQACGLVSTMPTPTWSAEADEIYRNYTIYHQSGGSEQPVFDATTGVAQARSSAIVQALRAQVPLPARGRLLDVGCGNGALLKACQVALPGWTLAGSEVSDQHRSTVEAIPGVERLWTVPPSEIPGQFDLISLVHVLEHIPGPSAYLRALLPKLRPEGLLLLQVPDCSRNPFILVVADHCSHFALATLAGTATRAGFDVLNATDGWVPKELSLVARPNLSTTKTPNATSPRQGSTDPVFAGCKFLVEFRTRVSLLELASFGIFGTAIGATWIDAETGGRATFFVDEDPGRIGRRHLERPILSPAEVPERARLLVPLPHVVASGVVSRLHSVRPDLEIIAA